MKVLYALFAVGIVVWFGMVSVPPRLAPLAFDPGDKVPPQFRYATPDDPYLSRLRSEYALEELVAGAETELETVLEVVRWVHGLWQHHGAQQPQRSDPISIIEEAEAGGRFRCVEYAIVTVGCLNALGIPARVLSLRTEDAATRESGAGHVVAEAYLRDLDRWVMVDAQWGVVPTVDGVPVSALDLQRGLATKRNVGILGRPSLVGIAYLKWVAPYLFYLSVPLDNRYVEREPQAPHLMLVPLGAPELTVFQRRFSIENTLYTHSDTALYLPPKASG